MIYSVILMLKYDWSWFSTKFRSIIVLCIDLFFSIDSYQSIYVKLKFPLKEIIFYNTSLLWKKWDKNQSIFNFLLYVTGTPQHFLRSNHLEMCYFHVYLHRCETKVNNCTESAISGTPHPKFWKHFVTDKSFQCFYLNTYNLPSFYCFRTGLSPSWCWIFLFNQLTLLLLCLNVAKLWHQKKWMPLKMSAFWME